MKIKMLIHATLIAFTTRGSDKLAWAGSPQRTFDLKSAYKIFLGPHSNTSLDVNWICKVDTLPHIKTFLWMRTHSSIKVKACLVRRGIIEEEDYPICQGKPKTILHTLRDCRGVKSIWSCLGVKSSNTVFWDSNLHEWLNLNGKQNESANLAKIPWKILFFFAIWLIWKDRNQVVFKRKTHNPNLWQLR